jgi:hypothetical protein
LKVAYPEYNWRYNAQHTVGKKVYKSQLDLMRTLEQLFPNVQIFQNFKLFPEDQKSSATRLRFYEYDISYRR